MNYMATTGRSILSAEQKKAAQYAGAIVSVVLFVILHTGGLVWFLSDMNRSIRTMEANIAAAASDRYRGADAARDFRLVETMMGSLARRIESLEKYIDGHRDNLEARVNGNGNGEPTP